MSTDTAAYPHTDVSTLDLLTSIEEELKEKAEEFWFDADLSTHQLLRSRIEAAEAEIARLHKLRDIIGVSLLCAIAAENNAPEPDADVIQRIHDLVETEESFEAIRDEMIRCASVIQWGPVIVLVEDDTNT